MHIERETQMSALAWPITRRLRLACGQIVEARASELGPIAISAGPLGTQFVCQLSVAELASWSAILCGLAEDLATDAQARVWSRALAQELGGRTGEEESHEAQ
ncbi:hypothetical protein F8S13_22180 [Chloroflexia bacterium SDU3-3]|nr:hypothetical protein F8S13_22180 [Chloroflexia bacterium SDU3-3]